MNKNYRIVCSKSLPCIRSEANVFEHSSGARIICLKNRDDNKVFSVSFKTPPFDNTGVFHIIEHCVLCGSKKYPLKDPFNELAKGSLYTYLNAMTFSDKTMYPIASRNDKDFYNLMDVYMDAVFFPKLYDAEESFLQEGWHNRIAEGGRVVLNGIVYNEMKGAYSEPQRILNNIVNRKLFADNAYSFDSAGDPEFIPKLRYTDFLDTHKKYYHPANSFIYLYGDVDIEKSFDILHEDYLSRFDKNDFKYEIDIKACQLLTVPAFCEGEYSVDPGTDLNKKNILQTNYIVGDYSNAEDYYAYRLLEVILTGGPGSPVKKALIESGIAEYVSGSFSSNLHTVFGITARNSSAGAKEFKETLDNILLNIAENGINKKLIESEVSKLEFFYTEEDYGYRPKGLVYNIKILSSWLYGGDPFEKLDGLKILARIKERSLHENYFENIIKTKLINNKTSVCTVLKPIEGLNEIKEKKLASELEKYRHDENELNKIMIKSKKLDEYQNKKDTEDDLAKIPFLKLSDIPQRPEIIPLSAERADGFEFLHTCADTNGIIYADILFDTRNIAEDKLHVIGFLKNILGKLNTEKRKYEDLSNDINNMSGGFSIEFECFNSVTDIGKYSPYLIFKIKYLEKYETEIFNTISEIINGTLFDDAKRIKDILPELKQKYQNAFINSGNIYALMRSEAYINSSGRGRDEIKGISFYKNLKYIIDNFDMVSEEFINDLKRAGEMIFNKENFKIHFTSDDRDRRLTAAKRLYESLRSKRYNIFNDIVPRENSNEAFSIPGKIMFNAMAGDYFKKGIRYSGYMRLLSNIISNVYFMDEIRLKGGAYGFGASICEYGVFKFYSYRDPYIKRTYDVFKTVSEFISKFDPGQAEMKKHILGTVNKLDRYVTPWHKSFISLSRYLCGKNYDALLRERTEILSAKYSDIKKYASIFDDSVKYICTVGESAGIMSESGLFGRVGALM